MGYILALTAVFFWSWNIVIAAGFATALAPLELACGRWVIATAILLPLAWRKMVAARQVLWSAFPLILGLAVTGIVIDNTLIYYAGRTASAVNIGMLDTTGPIFLVLLSRIFLKTPITNRQLIGLTVAVIGVVIIILRGDFTALSKIKLVSGDLYVLANTFAFAVYSLLQSKRPPQIDQTAMLAATAVIGVLILAVWMLFAVPTSRLEAFNLEDLAVVAYLGIFNSVISYLSWNTALNKIGNIKAGIIYYLLPVFSAAEAYLVLGEQIGLSQIFGGAIVIAGVMTVSIPSRQLNAGTDKR